MSFNPIFFITAAALSAGSLVLSVNGSPNIATKGVASFVFAPNVAIPEGVTDSTPVYLSIGGTQYQLYDKFAMPLVFSELPKVIVNVNGSPVTQFALRRPIPCGIGDDGGSPASYFFVAWNLPYPKDFIVPLR